jgi:hypothetical protein
MKAFLNYTILTFSLGFTLFNIGCSNKSSSNNGTVAPTYYMSNGTCYSSSSAQPVSQVYCANTCNSGYGGVNNGYNNGYGNNSGYYMNNGYCYTSNGQPTNMSYCSQNQGCSNTNSSGNYMSNGVCYSPNGQQLNSSYCNNNMNGNGYGQQANGACYGNYIYNNGGYPQTVQCNGYNCSGYTLTDSSGRQVYCQ